MPTRIAALILPLAAVVACSLSIRTAGFATLAAQQPATTREFRRLMQTVSDGWNEGNARKAADCFSQDAIYSGPPDPRVRRGRRALYEFFGGDTGRESPMRMAWHHLAFDEETQVGFGEYTFSYQTYQAHGVVAVRVRGGTISGWREYELASNLTWERFIGANSF